MHLHVLLENKQFLLLIDIPIQDRAHQITVHQVFTLDIPYGNCSAHYDINTRYFGVTKDATMGVELSPTQFQICQQANGQFCHISTSFQRLANSPTCIATLLYQKQGRHSLKMFFAVMQNNHHYSTYSDNPRCLDTHHTSYSSTQHSNFDMSRGTHGNDPNPTTNPHTEATHGLQCHFITFLPTP